MEGTWGRPTLSRGWAHTFHSVSPNVERTLDLYFGVERGGALASTGSLEHHDTSLGHISAKLHITRLRGDAQRVYRQGEKQ